MSEANSKTFKREVAATLAVASHTGVAWLIWGLTEADQWELAVNLLSTTLTADMLFAMGAFGMDALFKQRSGM